MALVNHESPHLSEIAEEGNRFGMIVGGAIDAPNLASDMNKARLEAANDQSEKGHDVKPHLVVVKPLGSTAIANANIPESPEISPQSLD